MSLVSRSPSAPRRPQRGPVASSSSSCAVSATHPHSQVAFRHRHRSTRDRLASSRTLPRRTKQLRLASASSTRTGAVATLIQMSARSSSLKKSKRRRATSRPSSDLPLIPRNAFTPCQSLFPFSLFTKILLQKGYAKTVLVVCRLVHQCVVTSRILSPSPLYHRKFIHSAMFILLLPY